MELGMSATPIPTSSDDAVLQAMDQLVAVMHEISHRNEEAARRVAEMREMRAQGLSYRDIATREEKPRLVELTRENLDDLLDAGGRLRRTCARTLHEQGLTMEQIAELLGVTRQRVSALLRSRRAV